MRPIRFLFPSRPVITGQVLGIVNRVITTHLVKKAGYSKKTARTGAVTLIQRFGSALNLNIHLHMLFLDGVYVDRLDGSARFRWVRSPTSQELTQLAQTIAHRVSRFLERQGLLERDAENSYLVTDAVPGGSMDQLLGTRSPIASRWARRQDARYLHCRRCRPVIQRNNTATRQAVKCLLWAHSRHLMTGFEGPL